MDASSTGSTQRAGVSSSGGGGGGGLLSEAGLAECHSLLEDLEVRQQQGVSDFTEGLPAQVGCTFHTKLGRDSMFVCMSTSHSHKRGCTPVLQFQSSILFTNPRLGVLDAAIIREAPQGQTCRCKRMQ